MAILNQGGMGFPAMAGAPQALQMAYMRDPRLRLAQMLQLQGSDASPVQHWTQGAARLAQALAGNYVQDKADREYQKQADDYATERQSLYAPVMEQGAGGAGPRPDATMRPAMPAELLQRAQGLRSPYLQDDVRQIQAMAMQEAAKKADPMYGRTAVRGVGLVDMRGGQPQVVVPEQRQGSQPSLVQEFEFAKQQGFPGDFMAYQRMRAESTRPQTNVTVNGDTGPRIGSIPQDYQLVQSSPGVFRYEVIPGSKTARELEEQAKKEGQRDAQKSTASDVVTGDIQRIFEKMDKSILPTTGLVGNVLSNVGGTNANDVRTLLQGIRSEIAFGRLQAMRDASPTGGALGAVTAPELELLQNSLGSLEQSQTEAQFRQNLARVQQIYNDIIHTDKHRGGGTQSPSTGAAPRANPRAGTGAQRPAQAPTGGIKFLGFEGE